MRFLILIPLLTACTPYIQAEMELVTQARKGVALLAESQASHKRLADAYHESRRRQLDLAFDEDVRNRADLTVDWVIDHRKAYATGLEALNQQASASTEAHRIATENLKATDEALQRLQYLQSLRLKLVNTLSSP